jgi:hypothetical protein
VIFDASSAGTAERTKDDYNKYTDNKSIKNNQSLLKDPLTRGKDIYRSGEFRSSLPNITPDERSLAYLSF